MLCLQLFQIFSGRETEEKAISFLPQKTVNHQNAIFREKQWYSTTGINQFHVPHESISTRWKQDWAWISLFSSPIHHGRRKYLKVTRRCFTHCSLRKYDRKMNHLWKSETDELWHLYEKATAENLNEFKLGHYRHWENLHPACSIPALFSGAAS